VIAVGLTLWFMLWLLGETISEFANAVLREFREFLQLRPSLKALNAFGLLMACFIVLGSGLGDIPVMPSSAADDGIDMVQVGAGLIYFALFVGALLLCVKLTKFEKR
jgi:hypothetical protein